MRWVDSYRVGTKSVAGHIITTEMRVDARQFGGDESPTDCVHGDNNKLKSLTDKVVPMLCCCVLQWCTIDPRAEVSLLQVAQWLEFGFRHRVQRDTP